MIHHDSVACWSCPSPNHAIPQEQHGFRSGFQLDERLVTGELTLSLPSCWLSTCTLGLWVETFQTHLAEWLGTNFGRHSVQYGVWDIWFGSFIVLVLVANWACGERFARSCDFAIGAGVKYRVRLSPRLSSNGLWAGGVDMEQTNPI